MLKKYEQPNQIPVDLERYVNMCLAAKRDEIPDIANRYFEVGDFFYHPDIGISQVEKNLGTGYIYCAHPELQTDKIPAEECTWLPNLEQIKKLAQSLNIDEDGIEKWLERKPKNSKYLKTQEEKWLAFYLFERYSKMWIAPKSEWKN